MAKFETKMVDGNYQIKLEAVVDSEDYAKILKTIEECNLDAEKLTN